MDERESEQTLRFSAPGLPPSDTQPQAPPAPTASGDTLPGAPPSLVPHPYQPYPHAPYAPAAAPAAPTNPQATASLVLGIASLFLSLLFVPSIVGVVLGIAGLARSRRTDPPIGRGAAVTGITLSVAGAVLGVFVAVAVSNFLADTARSTVDESVSTPEAGDGTAAPEPEEFVRVDAAQWESIVKHPDRAEGRAVVVFAEVGRFDGSTGPDRFLAGVGIDRPGAERELRDPAVVIGEEVLLAGVETGDVLRIHAVVTGTLDYETTLGGVSTLPALTVARVEDVGFADLSKDLAIGEIERNELGWVTVPVVVSNGGGQTFTYSAVLVAESKDGKTSYGEGTVFVEDIGPGRKKEVDVDFLEDVPDGAVLRVESLVRYIE